jgi:glycosidase
MRSVAAQQDDPRSTLTLYRRLLALRREHPCLATGELTELRADEGTLSYERPGRPHHVIIARLSETPATVRLPRAGRVVISSKPRGSAAAARTVELAPREAVVLELA